MKGFTKHPVLRTNDRRSEGNDMGTTKHIKPATQRNPRPQYPSHISFMRCARMMIRVTSLRKNEFSVLRRW